MLDLFHNLPNPTIWAGISFVFGVGLTGVAYHLVLKRYGPLQTKVLEGLSKANDKLVDTQDKQLAMMERTTEMQKQHYEAELAECKKERQEYKDTLHAKREEWQAESVKMQLLIQELEGRPDMTALNTTLEKVVLLIQTVSGNLDKHDKSIDERMKQFGKMIKTPPK